ncbi:hypothetical protein Mal64_12560 [Pseudobythopirellula maris]|uniref:Ice-binding protein C-terminal domain-containing protein n=1 Tax=Pseudobythopirellula maris TaxID=2527991 RepID=A0A5C5ZV01_9BACT|nr:PEP-CTERM sorting domain-containing protein [Pseudobythopirellula maris]TWT90858.1 hypothetical protein Mal64_12560 [Pseudobythopirellula maris]
MSLRYLTTTLAAFALVAALASSAQAVAWVSTADGGADTSIQNDCQGATGIDCGVDPDGRAHTVYGAGSSAEFRRLDDVRQKLVLLKFDISTLDASSYADAVLRLDINHNRTRTYRVYGIGEDYDDWDESITSYSNAPGILQPDQGGSAYGSAGNNFLDASELYLPGAPNPQRPNPFQLGTIGYIDTRSLPGGRGAVMSDPFNLDLEDFLNADTDGFVSFLIFLDASDGAPAGNVATKETTGNILAAPALGVLPAFLVPEPSTALLALAGVMGLMARRRS